MFVRFAADCCVLCVCVSLQVVKAVSCDATGCRCPDGAFPAADGVGCVLEIKEKPVVLPQLREPEPCFNNERDQDETDSDCGGSKCMRRCGSGQRCKANRDCATNLRCVKVTMSRGANGTVTQEARCSCPPGRYMSFKAGLPSCIRVQELCSNAQLDPSVESDIDW